MMGWSDAKNPVLANYGAGERYDYIFYERQLVALLLKKDCAVTIYGGMKIFIITTHGIGMQMGKT